MVNVQWSMFNGQCSMVNDSKLSTLVLDQFFPLCGLNNFSLLKGDSSHSKWQCNDFSAQRAMFLLFESFDIEDMLCYCREDDGSSLTGRFMTITEQRHESAKALKKCFRCFC